MRQDWVLHFLGLRRQHRNMELMHQVLELTQLARVCNACCSYRQLGFAFVSVAREQAQSFTNKQDEPR